MEAAARVEPNGLEVVGEFLRRLVDVSDFGPVAHLIVEAFERHGKLPILGVALVRSMRDPRWSSQGTRWLRAWTDAGRQKEEMQIPLRILKAGALYLQEGDGAALQALPREEREVLEGLLPQAGEAAQPPSSRRTQRRRGRRR